MMGMTTAEHQRLLGDGNHTAKQWKRWGPYVSERAWGTVREDYGAAADPWRYFPHDHARSRTYRWNEDGLGGICDSKQRLCLAFAFWNGNDPVLKERLFGLTGHEGNHGEDVKEYWWYLDSTPTHSWMRWRYAYPHAEFPYQQLVDENARRGRLDPEYELADTGVFDDNRYWEITADYAKDSPDDIAIRLTVRNAGPQAATLHVLPTLWFRNTWSWDDERAEKQQPIIRPSGSGGGLVADHPRLGSMTLTAANGLDPARLFCNNESNSRLLWGTDGDPYPKDGINDHVIGGAATVNPDQHGTKAALHYQLTVEAGASSVIELRLAPTATSALATSSTAEIEQVLTARHQEADDFYRTLIPPSASAEETLVARQAYAGMLWTKQFYHFDVERWLDGDPAGSPPPSSRKRGRNSAWRHLNNRDIISMPDKWEYPWYAAWDLAFHCVPLAQLDADFAKEQLVTLCREWYMHPDGQLPAYEWAFGDVNPPVHAWAALQVFKIDGGEDYEFLERIMHKLLLNFTWWVNRKDQQGDNVFEGGFLGLDNIGPIDRSEGLPNGGRLEQSDGTAWMAMYSLNLLQMALILAEHDVTYEDIATKFFEHFTYIANAMNNSGLWNEDDGFYYDVLHPPGAAPVPLRVRSLVGLLPLAATTTVSKETLNRLPDFASRFNWFLTNKAHLASNVVHPVSPDGPEPGADSQPGWLLSIVSPERLPRILTPMFDADEFLSPFGIRSLAKSHDENPFTIHVGGISATVSYEPAESESGLFGGNSNWRGPVWFPVNYLLIESLKQFHAGLGESFVLEYPSGSGERHNLRTISGDLARRLVSLFLNDEHGHRPAFGDQQEPESRLFQTNSGWHDQILFHEYFHGDNGRGLGASHQTGWTGLVATLIQASN